MRSAILTALVSVGGVAFGAGCDKVFGLEPPSECVTGHDEDDDGVTDACDVCPGDADEQQLDSDGDGIGDVCDVVVAGCQRRVAFYDFASTPTNLALDGASWSIEGEDLVQPMSRADDGYAHFVVPQRVGVRVRAGVEIFNFENPSAYVAQVGIGTGAAADRSTGYGCLYSRDGTGHSVLLEALPSTSSPPLRTVPYSGQREDTHELVVDFENTVVGAMQCTIAGTMPVGNATAKDQAPVPEAMGEVYIVSKWSQARIHWLEIIEPSCPPE